MAQQTTTTATNTTANETGAGAAPAGPPDAGPPDFVGGVVDGALRGIDVAAAAIRELAPDFVQDLVPFLVIDVFGTVI